MIIQKSRIYKLLSITNDHFKKWRKKGVVDYDGRVVDLSVGGNEEFFKLQCEKKGISFDRFLALADEVDQRKPEKQEQEEHSQQEPRQNLTLTQIKQKTEIKLNQIRIQKEEIDLAKKKGEVIEVEASRNIMQIVVTEFQNGNREDFKQLLNEVCEASEVPHEDHTAYQKRVDENMNRRAKTVYDIIASEIEKGIEEFKIKLRRGEHQ